VWVLFLCGPEELIQEEKNGPQIIHLKCCDDSTLVEENPEDKKD
jgi:hypothetical protein